MDRGGGGAGLLGGEYLQVEGVIRFSAKMGTPPTPRPSRENRE